MNNMSGENILTKGEEKGERNREKQFSSALVEGEGKLAKEAILGVPQESGFLAIEKNKIVQSSVEYSALRLTS